jgi:deoxyribonuclease-4
VAAVVRAAGAPVIVETPGGAEGQSADLEWLRQHLT